MPYSIVHFELAKSLKDIKNITKSEQLDFIIWSIIVDSSYDLYSRWINTIKREDSHYYKWEDYMAFDFVNNFYKKEVLKNKGNYLILWYYYHLIVDEKWKDDNFLSLNMEENSHIRYIYQISRKVNAFYDLKELKKDKNFNNIIDDLYNYKIDNNKLPSVFKNIDNDIINQVKNDILDYMIWKKHFSKWEDILTPYKIIDDHIEIKDDIKKEVEKYFSYKEYKKFKDKIKDLNFNLMQ